MYRIPAFLVCIMVLIAAVPAHSETVTAEAIFDKMIHYEGDQLSTSPSITDFRCKITETTTRPQVTEPEVKEKTFYFMVPVFQLQMMGEEPVFYFDQDQMLLRLVTNELTRGRDETVNDVDCYVITLTPKNPAYRSRIKTYYVAKDDYRHIRTVTHHSSDTMDNLTTQIDYVYGDFQGCSLLAQATAETKDADGNLIATTTAVYSDYEFGLGLTTEFFTEKVGNRQPNNPQG
jgi:hypothetical protein